jgi:hypothetical protein
MKRLAGSPLLWLALAFFAAPITWMIFQQTEGTVVYFHCRQAPLAGSVLGAAALAPCGWAGLIAFRFTRHRSIPATRRFFAWLAVGFAAIFGLGVVVMTAATILVPSCVR